MGGRLVRQWRDSVKKEEPGEREISQWSGVGTAQQLKMLCLCK